MGQAKLRGTAQERIYKAIERKKSLTPSSIECNNCGADISEISSIDSKSLTGVTGIYIGYCKECKSQTIAMTGDPEAVSLYMHAYAEFNGQYNPDFIVQKINATNN